MRFSFRVFRGSICKILRFNDSSAMYHHLHHLVICLILVLQIIIPHTNAYCWQSGWNPSFTQEPKLSQISITRVRVSWEGIVVQRKCADSFLVKYWRETNPSDYKMTDPVSNTENYVDIKVKPKVGYIYQVIAREDKGMILGVDYNKSKTTRNLVTPLR